MPVQESSLELRNLVRPPYSMTMHNCFSWPREEIKLGNKQEMNKRDIYTTLQGKKESVKLE